MEQRIKIVRYTLYLISLVILGRLFYWQVLQSHVLSAEAQSQRTSTQTLSASRGSILSSDGFVLTSNQDYYLLYSYKPQLTASYQDIAQKLAPILLDAPSDATEAAKPVSERLQQLEATILRDLSDDKKKWVPL